MIDSNDRDRLEATKDEMIRTLGEDELSHIPLLVFCNKQDLSGAMSKKEISDKLGLPALNKLKWLIQPCCATTGEGLYEGLDWLSGALRQNQSPKPRSRPIFDDTKKKEQMDEQANAKWPLTEQFVEAVRRLF